ncbi:MAG: thioesterase family protein [Bacteroidota bacterium]
MKLEYKTTFEVKWADVDPNGISFNKLMKLGIAPILFGTQTDFRREVLLSENITLDLELLTITKDGRKWVIKHNVYKENGDLAAEMIYRGAWFDLKERKVVSPPVEVYELMTTLMDVEHEE